MLVTRRPFPAESATAVMSRARLLLLEGSLHHLKRVRGTSTGATPRRSSKNRERHASQISASIQRCIVTKRRGKVGTKSAQKVAGGRHAASY